ncbi:uncharacterized protein LOC144872216 [Branchiostoma floridae x Branchiostoma japonicum]
MRVGITGAAVDELKRRPRRGHLWSYVRPRCRPVTLRVSSRPDLQFRRNGYICVYRCGASSFWCGLPRREDHATMKAAAMCWLLIVSLGVLAMDICTAEDMHVTKWMDGLPVRTPYTRGVPEYVTSRGAEKRESVGPRQSWSSILDGQSRQADYTRWQDEGRHGPRHVSEGTPWREASGGEEEMPRDEMLTSRSADLTARIRAPFGNKNAWVLYKRRSDNNNNNNNNHGDEDNRESDHFDNVASRIKRFMDKHAGFAVRAKSNAWILYKREGGEPMVPPQWER